MAANKINEDGWELRRSNNPDETPYWQPDVEKVMLPRTREMLEKYTGVASEDLVQHVKDTQKRSWDVSPFASVGALTWLNPYMMLHPAYQTILAKMKNGASILDCACMIAPDLRQLAYAGASTVNMYGFDIEPEFFNISYDFYNDRDRWKGRFFKADATVDFSESKLGELEGKMDIIWCAKFIHIFDKENQANMAAKLVKLLKPQPGSMFVGSQNGFPGGIEIKIADGKRFASQTDSFYLGDVSDIQEMWAEVERQTGTKWDMEANLLDMRTIGMHDDDGSPYKKRTGYNIQWTATMK